MPTPRPSSELPHPVGTPGPEAPYFVDPATGRYIPPEWIGEARPSAWDPIADVLAPGLASHVASGGAARVLGNEIGALGDIRFMNPHITSLRDALRLTSAAPYNRLQEETADIMSPRIAELSRVFPTTASEHVAATNIGTSQHIPGMAAGFVSQGAPPHILLSSEAAMRGYASPRGSAGLLVHEMTHAAQRANRSKILHAVSQWMKDLPLHPSLDEFDLSSQVAGTRPMHTTALRRNLMNELGAYRRQASVAGAREPVLSGLERWYEWIRSGVGTRGVPYVEEDWPVRTTYISSSRRVSSGE